MKDANLALRFLLELCALAALGYWRFQIGRGPTKFLLGLGVPLLSAIVWGMSVSPKAQVHVPEPFRFVLALVILGLAAVALAAAGRPVLASILAVLVGVNSILMYVWGQ